MNQRLDFFPEISAYEIRFKRFVTERVFIRFLSERIHEAYNNTDGRTFETIRFTFPFAENLIVTILSPWFFFF